MAEEYKLYIGGKWVKASGGKTFESLNPYDQSVNGIFAEGNEKDIDKAVKVAHEAFLKWRRTPATERGRYLWRMADIMRKRRDEFAKMESMDVGKPLRHAYGDIDFIIEALEYWAGAPTKIVGEVNPDPAPGILNYVVREPVGVCGLITPWNFPLQLSIMKIGPALATGNTVVLKPATVTPWTGTEFATVAEEAGLPPGVFNVVTGKGSVAGEALVVHPLVKKISLTGDSKTGKEIMRKCADQFKKCTLELGGKSPIIIFADADLEEAAREACKGLFVNTGQICCATTRLLLDRKAKKDVIDIMLDEVKKIRMGNPLDMSTLMGPLVSRGQRETVMSYIEAGKKEGAKVLCGGDIPGGKLAKGNFLNPTFFTGVKNSMKIAREEIFGPVGAIIEFDSPEEAMEIANDSDYALAASVYTKDIRKAHRMARDLVSGSVWVNTVLQSSVLSPWGGPKDTGVGRDNSMQVIEAYTEMKSIYINTEDYSGKSFYDPD